MTGLGAIFLARLTDPIGAFLALALGTFVPPRWIIPVGGLATAVVMEVLLRAAGKVESFEIIPFLLGVVAFTLWSALGNLAFRAMMGRASK
jgi:hypothetical protein